MPSMPVGESANLLSWLHEVREAALPGTVEQRGLLSPLPLERRCAPQEFLAAGQQLQALAHLLAAVQLGQTKASVSQAMQKVMGK